MALKFVGHGIGSKTAIAAALILLLAYYSIRRLVPEVTLGYPDYFVTGRSDHCASASNALLAALSAEKNYGATV